MTIVAIVNTTTKSITAFDSKLPNLADAFSVAGLDRLSVDHGSIAPGYMIIVYEFGLLRGPSDAYFRLGRQLSNGNAILYHIDDFGETIDFPQRVINHWADGCPDVEFFPNLSAIETAIAAGRVDRPSIRISGEIIWQWTGVVQ